MSATLSPVSTDRLRYRRRLSEVASGAPVVPLTAEDDAALCGAAMRLLRPSFGEVATLDEAVGAFCALLAHPDLSTRSLDRVVSDGLVGAPEVFDAFVAHPGCTPVLLVEAALSAWEQSRSTAFSAGPFVELQGRSHRDALRPRLLSRLAGLGVAGRLASVLLPSRGGDTLHYFRDAFAVLEESLPVQEVAVTLLEDARRGQDRGTFVVDVPAALDRARLLLA